MKQKNTGISQDDISIFNTSGEVVIKGCKITLNFLPESDNKTIETVKSILLSTYYQDISSESEGNLAG